MVSQMDIMTDEELEQFDKIFKRIDKDNDGAISSEELKQVMESTFKQVSKKEIQNMIRNADLDEKRCSDSRCSKLSPLYLVRIQLFDVYRIPAPGE